MSKEKEIIKKLASIVVKQQKAINKLAQIHEQHLAPQKTNKDEAETILNKLPANVKQTVARLEVHGNEVKVKFHPGRASDAAFDAIQQAVQELQSANLLAGTQYIVKEVI